MIIVHFVKFDVEKFLYRFAKTRSESKSWQVRAAANLQRGVATEDSDLPRNVATDTSDLPRSVATDTSDLPRLCQYEPWQLRFAICHAAWQARTAICHFATARKHFARYRSGIINILKTCSSQQLIGTPSFTARTIFPA